MKKKTVESFQPSFVIYLSNKSIKNSLAAFSFGDVGAKEKALKKKSAELGISRVATREEASAASTAPPFEKGGRKLLIKSAIFFHLKTKKERS